MILDRLLLSAFAILLVSCASAPSTDASSADGQPAPDRWVVTRSGIRHGGTDRLEFARGRLSGDLRRSGKKLTDLLVRIRSVFQSDPEAEQPENSDEHSEPKESERVVELKVQDPSVSYGVVGTFVRGARSSGVDRVYLDLPGLAPVRARAPKVDSFWKGSRSKWILRLSVFETTVRLGPDLDSADPDPSGVRGEWKPGESASSLIGFLQRPSHSSERRNALLREYLRSYPWRSVADLAQRLRNVRRKFGVAIADFARVAMPRRFPVAALTRGLRATCAGDPEPRTGPPWRVSSKGTCDPLVSAVRLWNIAP